LWETLGKTVKQTMDEVAADLNDAMKADRIAKDSPSSYAVVYGQCPGEW